MSIEKVDTLVVGAGQAGVAMSEHLTRNGVPHVVLERDRIAERWRTGRWDSLVANGPAWHDRFPGLEFSDTDPDAFVSKDRVADYFVEYANMIDAPIRCGVEVKQAEQLANRPGFRVETSDGVFEARNIVAATGAFQCPIVPPVVPKETDILQMHSFDYRNPDQLPDGAVMVVGAGSSGVQIADELMRAGKKVYLSVGPHDRPPRAYRGRDNVWWLGVLGMWDAAAMKPGTERFTICVSGARGGHTVDFRDLAAQGITLVGMTQKFEDGVLSFEADLAENVANGDAGYLSMLDAADAYVTRNGLDLPEDPDARDFGPVPESVSDPVRELNLAEAGVASIVWATGFSQDFSWLKVDAFDEAGKPKHQKGLSSEPGVYFLGLPWQSCRGSSFIWGVWHDAKHVADHIATQRKYLQYSGPSES
ncbi:flavin-containing monooxygenase [Parasedimentitalea psychrophila]|uniref:NAD(P)/FAD-dependent oxidoreductase n=1 Tax=Parasedimentitalea psychrophila TaxID=2997337 RepID=A0A9Y2L0M8_9RHOB|nr:NAD(P)/FAD-dependent oxidoreductase [Parasedimentitalea psychrophila]WIY24664.1 NAD(P)/FAD-dependent oxidoreductase [Parasedimentitalea psychrophila]